MNQIVANLSNVPTHVAIIMDGNGRWASKRGLPRIAGHHAGTENLRRIITTSVEFGIKYLTIYAFSTENWDRPSDEVEGLLSILADVIDRELDELNRQGVRLNHIGRLGGLSEDLQQRVLNAMEQTRNNTRLNLQIAWNYGGRDEIVCAISRMIEDHVKSEDVTPDLVNQYLFTAGIPDPDLVIRTSGEMRGSNFLIWQTAYSEWYFASSLWPDFGRDELQAALSDYAKRERRFGKTSSQVSRKKNAC
jgi:undecaprenyl diphosphate synthase